MKCCFLTGPDDRSGHTQELGLRLIPGNVGAVAALSPNQVRLSLPGTTLQIKYGRALKPSTGGWGWRGAISTSEKKKAL